MRRLDPPLWAPLLLALTACPPSADDPVPTETDDAIVQPDLGDPDLNGDGSLDILVIGTSRSIGGGPTGFAPDGIATELQALLEGDAELDSAVNVVPLDLHRSASIETGYGQGGQTYTWNYAAHSLAQFLYWPEGREARWADLAGEDTAWDHVVLAADPEIVANTPGYYALGANRIAARVAEGGAQTHLLMVWGPDRDDETVAAMAASTERIADLASEDLRVAPAALAWQAMDPSLQDAATTHPSENGASLSAASLYGQLVGRSAAESAYTLEDGLAEAAWTAVEAEWSRPARTGSQALDDPFGACEISDRVLRYNHTGTSSERGILRGLQWTLERARVRLDNGGDPPIHFNYGRANTEFEPGKRYNVDPTRFDVSLGFPMQDHSNHGDTSMLYGLDKRRYAGENGTDLGVARYMIAQNELPTARAVPIRTLYAQMQEAVPDQSAYSDGWHMNKDLDKATGAYMYTLLTGHCALDAEPTDRTSPEWRSWLAHKTGYETAWTLTHLAGEAPCFRVLPESKESTSVSADRPASLEVSFARAPTAEVLVTLSLSDGSAGSVSPAELTFTADNHASPQPITLTGAGSVQTTVELTATTASEDPAFDGLVDRWTYTVDP